MDYLQYPYQRDECRIYVRKKFFYMVAKFEHFSVIHGFLTFYIKFLLQIFYFFLK